MTSEIERLKDLESVAEWAKTAMDRRELYEATERYPHETADEYRDRREALWTNVKSAYAMLKASLGRPKVKSNRLPSNGETMSEQITCGRCGIPHCVPPCKDCGKPAEGHLCEKDVAKLNLQIDEANGRYDHALDAAQKYRVALEKIRDYIDSDYPLLSRAKEFAQEALIEKREGLTLGESRNLPYPKPISDDEAKKLNLTMSGCGHTIKAKDALCPICGV